MSRISTNPSMPAVNPGNGITRRERIGNSGQGRSQMKADFEKAAVAAGIDPSKLKEIEKKIQAQLISARSNPGSGFSLGAAIDSVLKDSGADLEKFHAMMQQLQDQRRPGQPTPLPAPAHAPKSRSPGSSKVDVIG